MREASNLNYHAVECLLPQADAACKLLGMECEVALGS